MPVNSGYSGLATATHSREENWRSFDLLPESVKAALREAEVPFSSTATFQYWKQHGTQVTLAQIKKISFKAYCNTYPEAALSLIGLITNPAPRRTQP